MHVEFYTHEILTAAGNFYIFSCNMQNLNAADIFQFLQNFHAAYKNSMHISNYNMQSKFCHRDTLFISRIFYCASWKVSCATDVSH